MSTKAELIAKMLEMQAKFNEHVKGGIDMEEYYADDGFMAEHVEEYNRIAAEVNAMAHAEAGSRP